MLSSILESQQIISKIGKSQEITKQACSLEIRRVLAAEETAGRHCIQEAGIWAMRGHFCSFSVA